MDWITILPNLSVGVISVLSLVLVVRWFIQHLERESALIAKRDAEATERLDKKESVFREFEREVRETTILQLHEAKKAIKESLLVSARVIDHLNSK